MSALAIDTAQDGAQEFLSAVVPLTHVDVRGPEQNPDNTWTMSGYAAVFNTQAIYLDSKWLQVLVELTPTAFASVLSSQNLGAPDGVVHFNLGHDMNRAVAATNVPAGQAGSLQLAADAHGLRYFAKVSKDDPDGLAMAVKMRDGVLAQASIAFQVGEQEITETETEDGPDVILRRITSVGALFDVCACPQGVFSQTVSELQEFAAPIFGQPGAVALGGHPRQPVIDDGGAIAVSPEDGGGVDEAWQHECAEMHRTLARLRR
jgi:HK97 family phage prohead protease